MASRFCAPVTKMIATIKEQLIGAGVVRSDVAVEAVVDEFGGSNTGSPIEAAFNKLVDVFG